MVPQAKAKAGDDDRWDPPKREVSRAPKLSFNQFLLDGHKFDNFEIERDPDTGGDVDRSDFV